jgi:PAS domain S-box-containing protein
MPAYTVELERIERLLKEQPKGLTITEISDALDLNRNSAAKYLDVLLTSGRVEQRTVGPAKIFFLSQRLPLQAMLNFSTECIVVLDKDMNVTQANEEYLRFVGKDRESIIGEHGASLPIIADQYVASKLRPAALEGKEFRCDVSVRKTNAEHYFHVRLVPSTFADGSAGVAVLAEEITKRKQVEVELRERIRQQQTVAALGLLALQTNVQQVMESAVESLARTLNVEYTQIDELTSKHEARVIAGVGWKEGTVGTTVPITRESQAGYTLFSEHPVIVEDLEHEKRFHGPSLLHEHKVVSGMTCIIYSHNKPWGILGVHTTQKSKFNEEDVLFLQSVANIIGLALERH